MKLDRNRTFRRAQLIADHVVTRLLSKEVPKVSAKFLDETLHYTPVSIVKLKNLAAKMHFSGCPFLAFLSDIVKFNYRYEVFNVADYEFDIRFCLIFYSGLLNFSPILYEISQHKMPLFKHAVPT